MDPYSLADHASTTDEAFGTTWNPDEGGTGRVDVGAKLAGKVNGFRLVTTKRGDTVPIMDVLAADDGNLYTVWINADLNRGLADRGVRAGDDIYLEYAGVVDLGQDDDGNPRKVKRYKVAAARDGHVLSMTAASGHATLPQPEQQQLPGTGGQQGAQGQPAGVAAAAPAGHPSQPGARQETPASDDDVPF